MRGRRGGERAPGRKGRGNRGFCQGGSPNPTRTATMGSSRAAGTHRERSDSPNGPCCSCCTRRSAATLIFLPSSPLFFPSRSLSLAPFDLALSDLRHSYPTTEFARSPPYRLALPPRRSFTKCVLSPLLRRRDDEKTDPVDTILTRHLLLLPTAAYSPQTTSMTSERGWESRAGGEKCRTTLSADQAEGVPPSSTAALLLVTASTSTTDHTAFVRLQ